MQLNRLKPARGATRRKKRVGCGPGSGHGKTSTHGHKGHQARSGYRVKLGFEGGQMPLTRRIPKRGFRNIGRQMYEIINIAALSRLAPNTEVTPEFLKEQGLIKGKRPIKILGDGELPVPLTVRVHRISRSAREKIIKAQGKVEELK